MGPFVVIFGGALLFYILSVLIMIIRDYLFPGNDLDESFEDAKHKNLF